MLVLGRAVVDAGLAGEVAIFTLVQAAKDEIAMTLRKRAAARNIRTIIIQLSY